MLVAFILGLIAAAATPYAEQHMKDLVESVLLADAPLTPMELRMFTFAALLVAASILTGLFGVGSGFALTVGAAVGVFGPRIIERVQARRAPDYSEDE